MIVEILIILALIAANAVFAGAEIAVLSVRKTRLRQLVDDGNHAARSVLRLRDYPERFLATVQIGITVVGSAAAALGGANIEGHVTEWLSTIPALAPHAQALGFAIVVASISYLSLVLGELVPKSLALRAGERYALLIGRPMRLISWFARPLVKFLTASSDLVLKPFGDTTSFTETRLSREELEQLVVEATTVGSVDQRAGEIAAHALHFGDLTAIDVMVPRNCIHALPRDASQEDIRRVLLETHHSRLPIFEENLDNVVGYITTKDLLYVAWEGDLIVLEDLIRPPFFVAEATAAVRVLQELQSRRIPLAMVVDEHGGLSGLVTFEDLVEELVGEMFSEDEPSTSLVERMEEGKIVLRGDASVRELNRDLDLDLPESDDWTTIAGLTISLAGRIPEAGVRARTPNGYEIEVLESTSKVVQLVRLTRPAPSPPPPRSILDGTDS
ncbi:MAG: HlyC/CorC family transporter [Deltaproteobacteria bacterium]|nr:HlyC/CorC family transporter [Deltaproteobacteria bacterium]